MGVRKQSKEENRERGGEEGKEEKGREKRGLQGKEKMDNGATVPLADRLMSKEPSARNRLLLWGLWASEFP